MSKNDKLLKKTELFEKVALYGDRSNFLKSLSQDYQTADLTGSLNNVINMIRNWINTSAEVQTDLPGKIKGLPPNLRGAFQTLNHMFSSQNFDVDSLSIIHKSLKELANSNNLGNIGSNAKNTWFKSVFPLINYAMDVVEKQISFLNNWRAQHSFETEKPSSTVRIPETTIESRVPSKSMPDSAKSLAKLVVNKVNNLANSKNRVADLKNINENVKSLQRYFKALQNSSKMQDYFARIDIVNALQDVYNTLDYNDLDIVSALQSGKGVPESPDAKI